jgi:uncharacterized protein YcbK (DUF882 family)
VHLRNVNIGSAASRLAALAALTASVSFALPAESAPSWSAPGLGGASLLDTARPLTENAWWVHTLLENRRLVFDREPFEPYLTPYHRPWVAGVPDWQRFRSGRYGRARPSHLSWNELECSDGLDASPLPRDLLSSEERLRPPRALPSVDRSPWLGVGWTPEPRELGLLGAKQCPAYMMPRPVLVMRSQKEYAKLRLLECDGSVSAEALDRVSVLMRPPDVPAPDLPLPNEPANNEYGEWVDHVKLVHPRLLWALQRISQAFPGRALVIASGYRRDSHGYHPRGRALDLFVYGVPNEALFRVCRTMNDVGCGYYPNNKFVHVDVRAYGSHHPMWVDVAEPGQPSRYVESWPGLIRAGADITADH